MWICSQDQEHSREAEGKERSVIMSFTRIIYKLLLPSKITFTLADIPKIFDFLKDLNDGKIVDGVEKAEFEKFGILAKAIDQHAELLPLVQELLRDRKKGAEVKEALLQNSYLVHSLFYSKQHVLGELSKIIDELEYHVRIEEEKKKTLRRVLSQPGSAAVQRCNTT